LEVAIISATNIIVHLGDTTIECDTIKELHQGRNDEEDGKIRFGILLLEWVGRKGTASMREAQRATAGKYRKLKEEMDSEAATRHGHPHVSGKSYTVGRSRSWRRTKCSNGTDPSGDERAPEPEQEGEPITEREGAQPCTRTAKEATQQGEGTASTEPREREAQGEQESRKG
jgi:hypothetical protein